MKNIFQEYKENINYFLKSNFYCIAISLTVILSYGFCLINYSVNIDTLSADRYFREGVLIGQKRITATLLDKIFNIMDFNPFFVDFIAVLFLVLAAINFCILFKNITNNKYNYLAYTIFSCIFLSYPLINEIFVYTPASLTIGIGFYFISISLLISNSCITNNKLKYIFYSGIFVFFATSLYESFISVYLVCIFIMLLLKYIEVEQKIKLKQVLITLYVLILPLLISLVLVLFIPNLCMEIFNIPQNNYANKSITYLSLGIIEGLKVLKNTILIKYFINALFYLPITIFVISNILLLVLGIITAVKKKSFIIFLLFLGIIFSTISLSIVQGVAAPYRTCQTFPIICGFAFMFLYYFVNKKNTYKILKNIITFIIFLIIFYQAKILHHIFYINNLRYQEEKNTLIKICNEIEFKYGKEKPVVFAGFYPLSKFIIEETYISKDDYRMQIANKIMFIFNIEDTVYNKNYKYIETNINSYLTWAKNAFGEPNTEIFKWIEILGYNFKQGTIDMYIEAENYLIQIKQIKNNETQIIEMEDYIIVNL